METMKAIRIHGFGGTDAMAYEDVPKPAAGPGEVLVRIHAAGVNPVDWKIREGRFQVGHPLPMILGFDFSGAVAAVGPGVEGFAEGDEVYGRTDRAHDGAYAEFAAVPTTSLATKPARLDHLRAAAVPTAALTAWQALDVMGLSAEQTILIHGAAGGVGSFAVQFARERRARIIATASERNESFLRGLGAEAVIDYHAQRFEDVVREVDAVLDTIGGDTQERSWQVLKTGGTLVALTSPPPEDRAKRRGVHAMIISAQTDAGDLHEIARLIDDGHVQPVLERVLPLVEARTAHEMSQSGHVRGKIVLDVAA